MKAAPRYTSLSEYALHISHGLQSDFGDGRCSNLKGYLILRISNHLLEGGPVRVTNQHNGIPFRCWSGREFWKTVTAEDNFNAISSQNGLGQLMVLEIPLSPAIRLEIDEVQHHDRCLIGITQE